MKYLRAASEGGGSIILISLFLPLQAKRQHSQERTQQPHSQRSPSAVIEPYSSSIFEPEVIKRLESKHLLALMRVAGERNIPTNETTHCQRSVCISASEDLGVQNNNLIHKWAPFLGHRLNFSGTSRYVIFSPNGHDERCRIIFNIAHRGLFFTPSYCTVNPETRPPRDSYSTGFGL